MRAVELVYAIPADAAEVGPQGKVSILGGDFENIYVQQFPSLHTRFSLVVKLLAQPSECGAEHTFQAVVYGPDGVSPSPGLMTTFTPVQPAGREDRPVGVRLVANFPFLVFTGQGDHLIRILVDEHEVGNVPFQVTLGAPGSMIPGDNGASNN